MTKKTKSGSDKGAATDSKLLNNRVMTQAAERPFEGVSHVTGLIGTRRIGRTRKH